MALGHLIVLVAHDGRAVDILGDLPAEALIEQVVLRRGGEILRTAHHVRDAHEVVVNDVGKVVGRQTVALDEHLIVQRIVVDGDVAEDLVVEGGLPGLRNLLADDKGLAGGEICLNLLLAQSRAAPVVLVNRNALGDGLLLRV